jgi:glycosyltransferase involved in cell wall biosynthesis
MGNLVSICIPAYNSGKWIGETIESAIGQTWKNKEVIIVDDGSSDDTLEIARKFQSRNVKVIAQENRGASAARNTARRYAQGDYIQWLDADDLLAPDKIETQIGKEEPDPNGRLLLSSAFGKFYCRVNKSRFTRTPLWQDFKPVDFLVAKFSNNIWMTNSCWIVSRKLNEMAGPWDERLTLDDDGEYFCRVVASSEKVAFVDGAKSFYRQWNSGSQSRRISESACRSLLLSLSLSIGYLRALEDSQRTREAGVKYLQTWYGYFYPEREELIRRANQLALELGGSLSPPHLSWKYWIINKGFGRIITKKVTRRWAMTKLFIFNRWDKFLERVTKYDW